MARRTFRLNGLLPVRRVNSGIRRNISGSPCTYGLYEMVGASFLSIESVKMARKQLITCNHCILSQSVV